MKQPFRPLAVGLRQFLANLVRPFQQRVFVDESTARKLPISSYAHGFLALGVAIAGFLILSKVSAFAEVQQLSKGILLTSPDEASHAVASIDPFTPYIQESSTAVKNRFVASDEGVTTQPVQPGADTNAPVAYTTYTVQPGDSASSIANNFNITVGTIQQENGLTNDQVNGLAPGQELKIASRTTSTSQDWLVALNKKKADAAAATAKQKRLALASRSVVTRERDTFAGGGSISFIFPLSRGGFEGVSRRLSRYHLGVDYRANTGTPVYAAADGQVIEITSGWGGGFGNSIVLSHGGGLTSRYAHLSQVYVGIGRTVSAGTTIALSGDTGNSTGPHLHFQTEQNGRPFDPGI